LQKQAAELIKENEVLKTIVNNQRQEETQKQRQNSSDTYNSNSNRTRFSTHLSAGQAVSNLGKDDYRLLSAIQASHQSYCISNPSLSDNPIIYASKHFLDMTGYRLDQVLGRNCRFLQGPGTDRRQVDALRRGISAGVDTSVCILNYKADGTPFYNQIFMAALRDIHHKIVNYIGVQVEVGDRQALCTLLSMISRDHGVVPGHTNSSVSSQPLVQYTARLPGYVPFSSV